MMVGIIQHVLLPVWCLRKMQRKGWWHIGPTCMISILSIAIQFWHKQWVSNPLVVLLRGIEGCEQNKLYGDIVLLSHLSGSYIYYVLYTYYIIYIYIYIIIYFYIYILYYIMYTFYILYIYYIYIFIWRLGNQKQTLNRTTHMIASTEIATNFLRLNCQMAFSPSKNVMQIVVEQSVWLWFNQKLNGTKSQRTPDQVSCDRAMRYSGFFGVRGPWVLLEISWIGWRWIWTFRTCSGKGHLKVILAHIVLVSC